MPSRNPVLLIHGIDDTADIFRTLTPHLQRSGWTVHCPNLVPNNGVAGLETLAAQVAVFAREHEDDHPIDIVGFSMGGVVARYFVQRLGGLERVQRLITIAAPHNGTWTAFLRTNRGARQMRPGSDFLRNLNHDVAMLGDVHFSSIWTALDLMIVPSTSSALGVGRSIRVDALAHPLRVRDRRVLRLVEETLASPTG